MTSKPYIIAEIGSNIFKDPDDRSTGLITGYKQIEGAKEAGADAVKFQMFTAEELYGPECRGKGYAYATDRWALPREWVPHLKAKCDEVGIDFMCSAFSVDGYEYLDPFVKMHKVASPEVLHPDLARCLLGKGEVLWSDGCTDKGFPSPCGGGIRMACVSKYPAEPEDYDLMAAAVGGGVWGLSDHTMDLEIAPEARRMGATYFERHVDFLWDAQIEGQGDYITPDSCVSFGAEDFGTWVKIIRETEVRTPSSERNKYARRKTEHGWFRPAPEGATD